MMNNAIILQYLSELEKNNDRAWYHAHKDMLHSATEQFESVIQTLIYEIGKADASIIHNEAKDLTFKLVRDTRYSHDKSPYNPAFRAHIGAGGKQPVPVGYYVYISPGNKSFLGGGLFADVFKDATKMIRDYITVNPEEWNEIIQTDTFNSLFSVKGTALKKVPPGYDINHPCSEYIKNKSWYLEYPVSDELVLDDDEFLDEAVRIFMEMKPFNDYLNRALYGFTMPKRK